MSAIKPLDPVKLTQDLIRCPSVTPEDHGALDILEGVLRAMDFQCWRLPFSDETGDRVDNLFARLGDGSPHFCFAGHTDVVPSGPVENWTHPPFDAAVDGNFLYGRGASDMKGAIASAIAAVSALLETRKPNGSISFLITGDEEGRSENGTKKLVPWLVEHGHIPDFCIVGEPSNPEKLGDMIKIGRRGSLNGDIIVRGKQGHVAYQEKACNPVSLLARLLSALPDGPMDQGSKRFPPTNLEITDIEGGAGAYNVIPGMAMARFNVRFNKKWTGKRLIKHLENLLGETGIPHEVSFDIKGEAFLTKPNAYTKTLRRAVRKVTGKKPLQSTTGGTSDARFIRDICPVVEFGLTNESIHQVDEKVLLQDLVDLKDIYKETMAELVFGNTNI